VDVAAHRRGDVRLDGNVDVLDARHAERLDGAKHVVVPAPIPLAIFVLLMAEHVHVHQIRAKRAKHAKHAPWSESLAVEQVDVRVCRRGRKAAHHDLLLELMAQVLDQVDDQARRASCVEVADDMEDARPIGERGMQPSNDVRIVALPDPQPLLRIARVQELPPRDVVLLPCRAPQAEPMPGQRARRVPDGLDLGEQLLLGETQPVDLGAQLVDVAPPDVRQLRKHLRAFAVHLSAPCRGVA
jgi:hypothetical protein